MSRPPSPVAQPKQRGRPPKLRLAARDYATITQLAGEGKRERWIHAELKISGPTWQRMKREDPQVIEALELGQEILYNTIVGRLLEASRKNNIVASIYLSKVLLGLRENEGPAETRPMITINLPDTLNVETYKERLAQRRAIEHDLTAPTQEVQRGG